MAPLDSTEDPHSTERRSCGRQKVLFSSVVIGDNRGRVLNISRNGLALETDTAVAEREFLDLSFHIPTILDWVRIRGQVAWTNTARNVVGIEFIGLSGDATKQIQNWMDSKREFSEASKTTAAVADRTVARETGTEIAAKGTTAESELSDLRGANTSQPPILPPVQYSPETNAALMRASELVDWATGHRSEPAIPPSVQRAPEANDAPTVAATPSAISVGGVGKAVKLVGPPLVGIAILLSVFFLRSLRVRESANTQKNKEPTRAVQPAAPPTQSVQLVPSGRRPQVPPSQPAASVSSPAMPAANQKPTLLGPAYVLQVAAMISENNANALANSLSEMNFPAFVLKMPTERFHHVFVGPYDSKDAGTEVKKDLAKRGFQVIRKEWPVKTN